MENARNKIILVDDATENLIMGENLLNMFYEVYPAKSAEGLFELLEDIIPDLILLDIEMPGMSGYEAIVKLKADPRFSGTPVIFLTSDGDDSSEMLGFDLGASDYVTKPFSGPLLIKRIANQLLIRGQEKELLANKAALRRRSDGLKKRVREKTSDVYDLQNAVLSTVADLVEFRDKHTSGHVSRTQQYLQALIDEMILSGIYADEVSKWDIGVFLPSAQLHDVGKIAITDLILNKPGKLTPEEFEIMKTHVTVGVDAIEQIRSKTKEHAFLDHAVLIAGTHHEKWDGSGYPVGLTGADIPIEGRLMAIADVYDALISVRPYKQAFAHEEACQIIEDGAGSHFDAALVDIFKKVKGKFKLAVIETVD